MMNYKKKIIRAVFMVILMITFHVEASPPDYIITKNITSDYGISFGSNLNIREEPNVLSKVIGQLNIGDIFIIQEVGNNIASIGDLSDYWYKIKFNNITGYVYGHFIEKLDTNQKIIISQKRGQIIFINDDRKLQKLIEFNPIEKEVIKITKDNGKSVISTYSFIWDIVKVPNPDFVTIEKVKGRFYSEYHILESKILDNKGTIIYHSAEPIVTIFNNGIVVILPSMESDQGILRPKNNLIIMAKSGNILLEKSLDMNRRYSELPIGIPDDNYYIDDNYFIWGNNTKFTLINIKDFKVKRLRLFDFPEEFVNCYINIYNISKQGDSIIFSFNVYRKEDPSQIIFYNVIYDLVWDNFKEIRRNGT